MGHVALLWPLDGGASYDSGRAAVRQKLRGWMLSGRVAGLHADLPSASWALGHDRSPVPLRPARRVSG